MNHTHGEVILDIRNYGVGWQEVEYPFTSRLYTFSWPQTPPPSLPLPTWEVCPAVESHWELGHFRACKLGGGRLIKTRETAVWSNCKAEAHTKTHKQANNNQNLQVLSKECYCNQRTGYLKQFEWRGRFLPARVVVVTVIVGVWRVSQTSGFLEEALKGRVRWNLHLWWLAKDDGKVGKGGKNTGGKGQ